MFYPNRNRQRGRQRGAAEGGGGDINLPFLHRFIASDVTTSGEPDFFIQTMPDQVTSNELVRGSTQGPTLETGSSVFNQKDYANCQKAFNRYMVDTAFDTPPDEFVIVMAFRSRRLEAANQGIFQYGIQESNNGSIFLFRSRSTAGNANKIAAVFRQPGGTQSLLLETPVVPSTTDPMLAIVRFNNTTKAGSFRLNGVDIGSGTATGVDSSAYDYLQLAKISTGTLFVGTVDFPEFAILPGSVTDAEIEAAYAPFYGITLGSYS